MEIQKKCRTGSNGRGTNICFDCKNACGGCSWTEFNPETKQTRFEPVPGWTAKPVVLNVGAAKGQVRLVETYHITNCPQFVRDEPRTGDTRELTEQQSKHFLDNLASYLRRWGDD